MTQQFFKGLFLALMACIVSAFGSQPVDYLLLAVAAVSTILTYTGKNLLNLLPSDSPAGALSWVNLLSGLLVAIGTGILESVGLFLIQGAIVWSIVLKVVLSAGFTYLGATFFAPQHNVAKLRGFVSPSTLRALRKSGMVIVLLLGFGAVVSAQSFVRPITADMVKQKAEITKLSKAYRGIDTLYYNNNGAAFFRSALTFQGFMLHYSVADGRFIPDNFARPGYGGEYVHCTAVGENVYKDYGAGLYAMPPIPVDGYDYWAFMVAGSIYDLGYRWELLRGISFNLGLGYNNNKELQTKERFFISPGLKITLPN